MAYKARRTRDLQGEVQAGTNVSVSETTKPDGTKVYTLSADSGETITISGTGLQLVAGVLTNLMAQKMGWTDESMGKINWTDDNGDKVLVIDPLEQIFLGDADDGAGFFIKQLGSDSNKLISGDIQIAENQISTEGVSLQTLVDKITDFSNSAITFVCTYSSNIYNNISYCAITGYSQLEIKDISKYYETETPAEQIGGIDVEVIKVKQNGRYKIDVYLSCGVFDDNYIRNIGFDIFCFRNNGTTDTIASTEVGTDNADVVSTGRYGSANTSYSIYVDLSAGDAITCYAYMDTNGTATIYSNETILSIQKIG